MERSGDSQNGKIADHLPLSVLLFHNAMERDLSLGKFADELGLSPLSLRQFIEGNTQRPRSKTLEMIATALQMPVEDVRRRLSIPPEAGPNFASWLQGQMQGRFSRARLTKETKISDGALRNYLAGQTLPDSDQARRLSEALGAPTMEIARLIIAHQTAQAGGVTVAPGSSAAPSHEAETEAVEAVADSAPAAPSSVARSIEAAAATNSPTGNREEQQILHLWRQLHPQARRATLSYIAGLLAEV